MKKKKLVILNRARNNLFVEYCQFGKDEIESFEVKNRLIIRLNNGRYEIALGYENTNLNLTTIPDEILDLEEIPSKVNEKCKGKKIILHNPGKSVKLRCNEILSVAGLIENLS